MVESAPHLGVHSNSIGARKSKRSKSASTRTSSEGTSDDSRKGSGAVSGTCHKCGGSLRRGNTALARQCPTCLTRFHASDCGSRLASSGYTGPPDVCPKCEGLCACVNGACVCHATMVRLMRERRAGRPSSAVSSGATELLDPRSRREPSFNSRARIDSLAAYPLQNLFASRPGRPSLGSQLESIASETMRLGQATSTAEPDLFRDDSTAEDSLWPAELVSRFADGQGVGITHEVNFDREDGHAPRAENLWGGIGFGSLFSSRRNERGEGSNRMMASPSRAADVSAESARFLAGVAGSGHATDGFPKSPGGSSAREKNRWAHLSDALEKNVDARDDSERTRERVWLSDEDARHVASLFE